MPINEPKIGLYLFNFFEEKYERERENYISYASI